MSKRSLRSNVLCEIAWLLNVASHICGSFLVLKPLSMVSHYLIGTPVRESKRLYEATLFFFPQIPPCLSLSLSFSCGMSCVPKCHVLKS